MVGRVHLGVWGDSRLVGAGWFAELMICDGEVIARDVLEQLTPVFLHADFHVGRPIGCCIPLFSVIVGRLLLELLCGGAEILPKKIFLLFKPLE